MKYRLSIIHTIYLNCIIDRTNASSTINVHWPKVIYCCRQHPRNPLPFLPILCSSIFSSQCTSLFCIHEFLDQRCVLKRLSPQWKYLSSLQPPRRDTAAMQFRSEQFLGLVCTLANPVWEIVTGETCKHFHDLPSNESLQKKRSSD